MWEHIHVVSAINFVGVRDVKIRQRYPRLGLANVSNIKINFGTK